MGLRLRGQELPKTIPSWGSLAITVTPWEAPGWLTSSATVEFLLHPVFSVPGGAYKIPSTINHVRSHSAFCTFWSASSKPLNRGCPCPLSGSFGSCIQGSQQDLLSRLLWCGVPQGRLDGCGQANSQVDPHHHVSDQTCPDTSQDAQALLFLQRAGCLLPKMVRNCREVPES